MGIKWAGVQWGAVHPAQPSPAPALARAAHVGQRDISTVLSSSVPENIQVMEHFQTALLRRHLSQTPWGDCYTETVLCPFITGKDTSTRFLSRESPTEFKMKS